jgi:hypothetical protein
MPASPTSPMRNDAAHYYAGGGSGGTGGKGRVMKVSIGRKAAEM